MSLWTNDTQALCFLSSSTKDSHCTNISNQAIFRKFQIAVFLSFHDIQVNEVLPIRLCKILNEIFVAHGSLWNPSER